MLPNIVRSRSPAPFASFKNRVVLAASAKIAVTFLLIIRFAPVHAFSELSRAGILHNVDAGLVIADCMTGSQSWLILWSVRVAFSNYPHAPAKRPVFDSS
jgi:hypothetical protein